MSIDFKWIGWNCNEGHDKVWAYFETSGALYCTWGRRGKRLSFKDHGANNTWHLNQLKKLQSSKEKKGYTECDQFILFSMFPDFEEQVEQELLVKTLSGQVR